MENTNSLRELDIDLDWDVSQSHLERLRGSLSKSFITGLRLGVSLKGSTACDASDRGRRYSLILDIMRQCSTKSVAIIGVPGDFIQLSILPSQSDGLLKLKHLDVDLPSLKEDVLSIKLMVAKARNLSSLVFQDCIKGCLLLRLYMAIAEHQRCPITFTSMSLCIPPLTTVPYQPLDPSQYLAHLLNTDGIDIMLVLEGSTDEEAIVDALAKIEGNRTGLETLYVQEESMEQGVRFIQNVAKVISKSELSVLDVHLTSEEGRAQILDSIQWEHIRRLTISTDEKSVGIRAMKALVEGRNKCNGPVVLDYFKFSCYCSETALDELPVLLRSFLASTSIETLWLLVQMTPPDLGSVLKTADLSRLDYINLKVDDYSSDEVDGIFECLKNTPKLSQLMFDDYNPTSEQRQWMNAKNVYFA